MELRGGIRGILADFGQFGLDGIDMDRVFTNVDRYGNTSSASIPIALDEAVRTVLRLRSRWPRGSS